MIVSVFSAMANLKEQKASLGVSLEIALVDLNYFAQQWGMLPLRSGQNLQRRKIAAKFVRSKPSLLKRKP